MKKQFYPHLYRVMEARPDLVKHLDPLTTPVKRDDLFFSHTSGVEFKEAEAILAGIEKIKQEVRSRLRVKNYGVFNINNGPFGNSDWYQKQALISRQKGFGQQANVYTIHQFLLEEPYQRNHPHLDFMAFDCDLTTGEADNNFVYGSASYPNIAFSVARFRGRLKDLNKRKDVLAVLAAHELGHNFGLVGRNFNWVNQLGAHCHGEQGPCLMEQVDVPDCRTMEQQTRLIIDRTNWLCSDCLEEASFKRLDLYTKGILW